MSDTIWHAANARSTGDDASGTPDDGGGLLARLLADLVPSRDPPSTASIDARVLVLGTFGTEAVADHLEAVLGRRGRDTHTVTVTDLHGGQGSAVGDLPERLPVESLVIEGTGSAPTAVRSVGDLLGPPDVVVVTAIGRDDLERIGPDRDAVVRAFASAVPPDAHVVNAEGAPPIRRYLSTAVRRRGATIEHVHDHDATAPGAELAGAIDAALAALDEPPLPEEERTALIDASRPQWLELPEGRIYDALGVTDTVAIERLRAALAEGEPVDLLVALPRNRRDFAATLVDYLDAPDRAEQVGTVNLAGPLSTRVADRTSLPTAVHGTVQRRTDAVLDEVLSDAPVLVVGSDRPEWAGALSSAITERIATSETARIG